MGEPRFVTLSQAVTMLDLASKYREPERWLVRTLRARERKLGMNVLISERGGRGARYRINVATLQSVMHELHSPRDVASAKLGERLVAIEREIRTTNENLEVLTANVQSLTEAYAGLLRLSKQRKAA